MIVLFHQVFRLVLKGIHGKLRLSDLVLEDIPRIYSKNQWKKIIKEQSVFVNGTMGTTGTWVQSEDILEIDFNTFSPANAYEMKLEVIYEDEDIIVVNKPSGIIVSGNKFRTLENALLHHLKDQLTAEFRPRFIHRLDGQTSGLIVGAKNYESMLKLQLLMSKRRIEKKYLSIVAGEVPVQSTISLPIKGKSAMTSFQRLRIIESKKYGPMSLLLIKLNEGRTHQIRIHMNSMGHPVIGDKLYNYGVTKNIKGLFLHAVHLRFSHPKTNEPLVIHSPIPKRFEKFGVSRDDLLQILSSE